MKIHWAENPLASIIELDDHDKEVLRLKIKIDQLEDRLFDVYFYAEPSRHDMQEILNAADMNFIYEGGLDKRVDDRLEFLLSAANDTHAGDCTAFPANCIKCDLEQLLGIDTTPKMPKSVGYQIFHMFITQRVTSCDEVIKRYQTGEPLSLTSVLTQHWLQRYQNERLNTNEPQN